MLLSRNSLIVVIIIQMTLFGTLNGWAGEKKAGASAKEKKCKALVDKAASLATKVEKIQSDIVEHQMEIAVNPSVASKFQQQINETTRQIAAVNTEFKKKGCSDILNNKGWCYLPFTGSADCYAGSQCASLNEKGFTEKTLPLISTKLPTNAFVKDHQPIL